MTDADSTDVPRSRIDARGLAAAIVLGTVGALTIMVVPGFVTLIAAQSGLDDRHLGFIAAWDINATAIAIGAATFLISRLSWRGLAIAGTTLIVIANLWTAASHGYEAIVASRVCAGVGEGLAIAVSFAALGRAANPDRAFGIYLVVGLAVSAAALALFPIMQASVGSRGVFVGLALVAGLSATLLFWLPEGNRAFEAAPGGPPALSRELAATGLLGVFLYFIAQGALWSYFERIGAASGIDPVTIGEATGLSSLSGVGGAMLAVWSCTRIGRPALLLGSGVVSIASFFMLRGHVTGAELVISGLLFNFAWNLAQPLLSGVCADADSRGRVVVVMGCIQTVGFGAGPAFAAMVLRDKDYSPIIWLSTAVLVASLLIVVGGLNVSKRRTATVAVRSA